MSRRLLIGVQTPALPQPPSEFTRGYMGTLLNVLRLFFNSLASTINSVIGTNGGRFIEKPYGQFYDDSDQALGAANVGQPVTFNQTYLDNAVTINGLATSQITVEYSGVYNIQFTGQVRSNSSSSKIVYLWVARDGTPITFSGQEYSISGLGKELQIEWNFVIDIQAGSYIELYWSGNDIDLTLDHVAPTAPHPGIASAVVAVLYVSALPEVLPVLP